MTIGDTEEAVTCGGLNQVGRRTRGPEGTMSPPQSVTTISTIAVQAGQSQIVVSVLKSGSEVHVQLVHVHPGLSEIGLNQEENQSLIVEQQQLLEKLKKHEKEVLSSVEKKRKTEQKKRDEGLRRRKRDEEQEEEVMKAMEASLSEGWSLLLCLLQRRQQVLILVSDFYCRAQEFAVGIDRVQDLQIRPDHLTEDQLTYDSMRRDLLGKSLQFLSSSSVLLQKLRRLQRTEALQRRGGVLQDEDEEEDEESSRRSRGSVLRLEQLVETLQDRRRKVDQQVRLQIQQAEQNNHKEAESRRIGPELCSQAWSLDKILDQDLHTILDQDLQASSRADLKPGFISEEAKDLMFKTRSDLKPGCESEETRDLGFGSSSDLRSGSLSDENLRSGSTPVENEDLHTESTTEDLFISEERPECRSEDTIVYNPSRSHLKPGSRLEEMREHEDLQPEFRLEKSRNLESGSISEMQPGSRSDEIGNLLSGSDQKPESKSNSKLESRSDQRPRSRLEETQDLKIVPLSDLQPRFRPVVKFKSNSEPRPESRSEENRDLLLNLKSVETIDLPKPGSRLLLKSGSISDLTPESTSEKTIDLKRESSTEKTTNLQPGSTLDLKPESTSDLKPGFSLKETKDLQPESRSEPKPGSKLYETGKMDPGSVPDIQTGSRSHLKSGPKSEQMRDIQPGSRSELQIGSRLEMKPLFVPEETRNQQLEQIQELLSSCDRLTEKVWCWVQQSSSVLSTGRLFSEAEHNLKTHLLLQTQGQAVAQDAESMKQILEQIRALSTEPTIGTSGISSPLSPLKALTEQLKRTSTRTTSAESLSPELAGRVDLVLKELQSLNQTVESNLQLLKPYVAFLRMTRRVEEEFEELKEMYSRRPDEEEEREADLRVSGSKAETDVRWQEALQRFTTVQELGNNCTSAVTTASESGLNLQSVRSTVQETTERLNKTKEEVNELRSRQQIQIQQQQEDRKNHRTNRERLFKDLNSVSDLLDSCTLVDLGSDLQTSKLLERFILAGPHFTQLNNETEFIKTPRGVQDRPEEEEDLSELLKLHQKVKEKIKQSQLILELSSRFHCTTNQLEALLQSDPLSSGTGSIGLCGSCEAKPSLNREDQQQIQNLFNTASALKTDICNAIEHTTWSGFRSDQLEARLLSLDSLCVSWLKEASRQEEKLRRETRTRKLNEDINQLRDSFKELKKRFSNLKFNYLKRNDRSRNMKAVRNQLQQVETYDDKLQALRKRLQGLAARLGSEVKDGGVARETEDGVNELQRQMGEFERSVREHQKTLDMTCRLQQAMDEYQFWCDEASATIARVGKFSSECRSTEAVSVLYRQFEKFVWPTVPQQEERISQITELSVRLHGVEEGRRYIEKTVSKHSEMVQSIRELSDGLMKLEARLKVENLKQQQKDEEEMQKNQEKENREVEMKQNRKMKKKEQTDNRNTQEAAEMYELKETGHTPELTAEHHGKEMLVKRHTAANRKPPLQKSRSQDTDRASFCSTHTFSLSSSLLESNRMVYAISSQSLPSTPQATPPPTAISPSSSDVQREIQRKKKEEAGRPFSSSCGLNTTPVQDLSAAGPSVAEVQHHDVLSEDSMSTDEYECPSPDDISLPPLAETPESSMIQSDVEEGFCFSSHSVHVNQYGHLYRAQSDHSEAGSVAGPGPQQRECSQMERCPTPPTGLHSSSSRFRSESGSFVQSPGPTQLTSTLCGILRTEETSSPSFPQSADLSLDCKSPSSPSGSNPVHQSNIPNNCSNKDKTLSKTDPVPQTNSSDCKTPKQDIGFFKSSINNAQMKTSTCPENSFPQSFKTSLHQDINYSQTRKETTPKSEPQSATSSKTNHAYSPCQESPSSQSDPIPLAENQPLTHTRCLFKVSHGSDPTLNQDRTLHQDKGFLHFSAQFPQTQTITPEDDNLPQSNSRSGLDQDVPKETLFQSSSLTTTTTKQTIFCQPSNETHLTKTETLPQISLVSRARGFAQSPSSMDPAGPLKSCAVCPPMCTITPQDSKPPQSYPDSRSGFDQDVPSLQISKEIPQISMSQSSNLTTTTAVIQETICTSAQVGDPHPAPHKDRTLSQSPGSIKSNVTFPQKGKIQDKAYPGFNSGLNQKVPSLATSKKTPSDSSSLNTTTNVTEQTVCSQSSSLDSHCTLAQVSDDDPALHKDRAISQDTESLKSSATCTQKDTNQDKAYPEVRRGLKNNKETPPSSRSLATTLDCQSSPPVSHCILPQASSSLRLPMQNHITKAKSMQEINPLSKAKDSTLSQDNRLLKCDATCPQRGTKQDEACPDFERGLDQDLLSLQNSKDTSSDSGSLTTTTTQPTVYCQSSSLVSQVSSSLSSITDDQLMHSETSLASQVRCFAQKPSSKKEPLESTAACPPKGTKLDSLQEAYPDFRRSLDQNVPSFQETPTDFITQSTTPQQTIYSSDCNVPQSHSGLGSLQESPFTQTSGSPPQVLHAPMPPEPDSISNISSNRFSSQQTHQTVYSLHESLTSTCTQQCVHDPGMSAQSAAAPPPSPPLPPPEVQTQALAQQANPHATPPSSPLHLLTPDQDPDICQPVAIREEIRLTPQIKGPPLPAPPPLPQAQAESLPQGKASTPGPHCFTRPLSRATVMEGSPVTLEVEVTGHPEPTLTWCSDGVRALVLEEGKPLDGVLCEAWLSAGDKHSSDKADDRGLVAEVYDVLISDWHTWFGTLCFLLWLLFLIVL